jgi:mannitol-1-phosphate/altronate dehydrogenase
MCAWRMRRTSLAVLALASLRDSKLADWVGESANFPNIMLDRITPVTAEKDIAALVERYGVIDRRPVFAETFT